MRKSVLVLAVLLSSLLHVGCTTSKNENKNTEISTSDTEKAIDINTLLPYQDGQSCAQLSDQFCDSFWSARYRGNVDFPSGRKIRFGSNKTYLISEVRRTDFEALLNGACQLPKDLRTELGADCSGREVKYSRILKRLKKLLATADSDKTDGSELTREKWRDGVSDVDTDLGRAIREVATRRSYKDDPGLETKRWHHQSFEEKQIYYRHRYDISNRILEAKYKNHPNWLLVEKLFTRVRKDVIELLKTLNLPEAYKAKMIHQVETVQLTLPYRDPRLFGADKDCATKEKNAFYDNYWHKFTVCVGYMNAVPVEGLLYRVIAHEISHSFDPQRMAQLEMRSQPWWPELMKLENTNAGLSCQEWDRIKKLVKYPKEIHQLPKPLVQFNQCLVDRSGLKKLTVKELTNRAIKDSFTRLDDLAADQWFSSVANNEIVKNWKKVANPAFMDAFKKVSSEHYRYLKVETPLGWPRMITQFVQEYKCQGIDPEKSPVEERRKAFDKSIAEVNRVTERLYAQLYAYEGLNSRQLAKGRLARSADEGFADWISMVTLSKYLLEFKDVSVRRENMFASIAGQCDSAKSEDFIQGFKEVERKYSTVSHPVIRKRRLRQLGPAIAKALRCKPVDLQSVGMNRCELRK